MDMGVVKNKQPERPMGIIGYEMIGYAKQSESVALVMREHLARGSFTSASRKQAPQPI